MNVEMSENNKAKKFICKYCNRDDFKNNSAKSIHEIWCADNPDKTQANIIRKKHVKKMLKYYKEHPGIRAGKNNPFYNKHQTEEVKRRMRERNLKYYEEHPEAKQKLSEKRIRYLKENPEANRRENNPNFGNLKETTLVWNDWTYTTLHNTVKRLKTKPEKCEICRKKTQKLHCSYDFFHQECNPLFYSLNPKNYVFRCVSCHRNYDNNAFWTKWTKEQIEIYTKNLQTLKKKWPDGRGFKIEKEILKKLYFVKNCEKKVL